MKLVKKPFAWVALIPTISMLIGCAAPNAGGKDVLGKGVYKAHQLRKDKHEDRG